MLGHHKNRSSGTRSITFGIVSATLLLVSSAHADTFFMNDGKVHNVLVVVSATDEILYARTEKGSLVPIVLDDVGEVEVDVEGREPIRGRLVGFLDGEYKLDIGAQYVRVADGEITMQWQKSANDAVATDVPEVEEQTDPDIGGGQGGGDLQPMNQWKNAPM